MWLTIANAVVGLSSCVVTFTDITSFDEFKTRNFANVQRAELRICNGHRSRQSSVRESVNTGIGRTVSTLVQRVERGRAAQFFAFALNAVMHSSPNANPYYRNSALLPVQINLTLEELAQMPPITKTDGRQKNGWRVPRKRTWSGVMQCFVATGGFVGIVMSEDRCMRITSSRSQIIQNFAS